MLHPGELRNMRPIRWYVEPQRKRGRLQISNQERNIQKLLTHSLIPRCRILLEKVIGPLLVKKLTVF
jgi:hypothetical protein